MIAAAQLGHASAAQQLLLLDPAAAHGDAALTEESPLQQAALHGNGLLFKRLLAAAPEAAHTICDQHFRYLEVCSPEGEEEWSLMHSAAEGGCAEAVQALLELAPETASCVTARGLTPLHAACDGGNFEAARLLLNAAPQTAAAADAWDRLPLHCACAAEGGNEGGNADLIRYLLAAGAPGLDEVCEPSGTFWRHTFALCSRMMTGSSLGTVRCTGAISPMRGLL